eukprot:scaffold136375_cov46-Prasinocladus_malaysianus.AAC.1
MQPWSLFVTLLAKYHFTTVQFGKHSQMRTIRTQANETGDGHNLHNTLVDLRYMYTDYISSFLYRV